MPLMFQVPGCVSFESHGWMLCGNERCAAWNKHQLFSVAGKMEDVKRGEGNDVGWMFFSV